MSQKMQPLDDLVEQDISDRTAQANGEEPAQASPLERMTHLVQSLWDEEHTAEDIQFLLLSALEALEE